ncbi:putative nuclease HARBI1 [Rhizophagus irregularis DAOM 181602=DAOM 197198]|nr:putative nuclease HARBI1 [Rhizophagus irregularis DAOM 181602=DAOM 197198]
MERQQFNKLVQVLQNDTVFQNKGNKPQAPVEFQLVIFLRRLGSKDDILSICSRFGICEGTCTRSNSIFYKKYAINCQGIVDFKGIFINYIIGWPGSVHDARVYANSDFFLNTAKYIEGDDYVLELL